MNTQTTDNQIGVQTMNTKQNEHGLPWTVERNLKGRILAANGEPVALPCSGPTMSAPVNAAFIVRACNSHADLLEACRMAVQLTVCKTVPDDLKEIIKARLSTAIARATGQEGE